MSKPTLLSGLSAVSIGTRARNKNNIRLWTFFYFWKGFTLLQQFLDFWAMAYPIRTFILIGLLGKICLLLVLGIFYTFLKINNWTSFDYNNLMKISQWATLPIFWLDQDPSKPICSTKAWSVFQVFEYG